MPIIGITASQNYPRTITVDYLVVAGGAGGGGNYGGIPPVSGQYDAGGGGGGAGGLRCTVTATGGGGSLESAITTCDFIVSIVFYLILFCSPISTSHCVNREVEIYF